jgi:hypothetical protein
MKDIIKHIRKSWYKYLLEIIVIASGIILAFGLNTWNEGRKSTLSKVATLKHIKNDLVADSLQLYNNAFPTKIDIDSVLHYYTLIEPNGIGYDSLSKLIGASGWTDTYQPIGEGYKSLSEGGLSNDSISQYLIRYYDRQAVSILQLIEYQNYYNRQLYLPYMLENISRGSEITRIEATEFIQSRKFRRLIDEMHWTRTELFGYYIRGLRLSRTLIPLIDKEIARLEGQ